MKDKAFEEAPNERYEAPVADRSSALDRIQGMSDLELIEACSGWKAGYKGVGKDRFNSMEKSISEHGKLSPHDRRILVEIAFKKTFKIAEYKSLHDLLGITWKEVWDIKKGKETSVLTPTRKTEMLNELKEARADKEFVSAEEYLVRVRQIYLNYSQEVPEIYKEKGPATQESTPSPT